MYSIEYYKTKRTQKNPMKSKDMRIIHLMLNHPYLDKNKLDLIDKCLNIKSLTIDLEDIKYAMYDKKIKHLPGLFAMVNRVPNNEDIDAIIILNNNYSNWLFICEILRCSWMINRDEEINNSDILKAISRFLYLNEQYENADDSHLKRRIKNEMSMIKYYLHTIIKKNNSSQIVKPNFKTLKLGKRIIKQ